MCVNVGSRSLFNIALFILADYDNKNTYCKLYQTYRRMFDTEPPTRMRKALAVQ